MLDDRAYIKSKQWDSNNFGYHSPSDYLYFNRELSKSNLSINGASNVLEIGFGNGNFQGFCKSKGWQITGVESNSDLIFKADASGFNVLHTSSISKLQPKSFDFVFAFDVIEHIKPEEIISFFRGLHDLLKPNGIIFLRFPNGDSPLSLYIQNGDLTHQNAIGSRKIKQIAIACNFQLRTLNDSAYPLYLGTPIKFPFRVLKYFSRKICNFLFNLFLHNGQKIYFVSENLSVTLIKLD